MKTDYENNLSFSNYFWLSGNHSFLLEIKEICFGLGHLNFTKKETKNEPLVNTLRVWLLRLEFHSGFHNVHLNISLCFMSFYYECFHLIYSERIWNKLYNMISINHVKSQPHISTAALTILQVGAITLIQKWLIGRTHANLKSGYLLVLAHWN